MILKSVLTCRTLLFSFLGLCLVVAVGCDIDMAQPNDKCDGVLKAGDDIKCTEGDRRYYLYASKNWNPSSPTALIVDAHGAQSNAEQEAGLASDYCAGPICLGGGGSGWRLEADMPGNDFLVLTPQGLNDAWVPNDESFIIAAIETAKQIASIDIVFMSGISNGGMLTYWTGCPNTDIISGFAPIVGGYAPSPLLGNRCSEIENPVPVISFDAEPDFAYASTKAGSDNMVKLNNCKTGPVPYITIDSSYDEPICRDDCYAENPKLVPCSSISPAIKPTVCKKWTDCDNGVEVVFCDVDPANKYGSENASLEAHVIVANDTHLNIPSLAWRFFKEHY